MQFVIDASAAIKWVIEEAGSEQASAVRRHDLIAPNLLYAECSNILWKVAQRGGLTRELALQKVELLYLKPMLVIPDGTLMQRALAIALDLGHPAYDCFYLAAAELHGVRLITADLRLLRRVATSLYAHLAIDLETAATN